MNYQVGNYVLTEYGELPIKHVVFGSYQVTGKDGRTLWANKVEPIKLTEEWLIKLGFVKIEEEDTNIWSDEHFYLKNITKDGLCFSWYANNYESIDIDFVHQLQNLYFAITAIELKPILYDKNNN